MNTELQNKAWSALPKEFKEEVKKLYREFTFTREGYYVELFGLHNLTSDSEKLSEPKPTEPEEKSRNLSQETANCDKHFDNILKDSFRNERRLNMAASATSAG